jgi:ADP-heptose:LPS heptosyltransferase
MKINADLAKFLIIRFSSIGDIVLTTPVIRCLKKQVPEAEVHYCTKRQYADVLKHNMYIDKLHLLEEDFQLFTGRLKEEKFDYIIDLHSSLRSRRLRIALGTPSFAFNKINFRKWLMVQFKHNHLPATHIVDRYLATLKRWNIINDMQGLDYFYTAEEGVNKESIPATHRNGYIAFAVGARHFTKQLPADLMTRICSQLNFPAILLGGPEDKEKAEEVARKSSGKVWNSCGSLTLNQSASIVKNALAVITPDTGLMHIAAAFKKIIVSVWGNTIPEFGMSPYLADPRSRIFEISNLSCRPCSKIGFNQCPKGHFRCMNEMPADEIARYANKVASETERPRQNS